jgi:MFS family permease
MTMTPVHMDHHGASITVVGLTISIHVLGMFAFSPLVGIAADRLGRYPVIVAGGGTLLVATLTAGTAGSSMGQVTAGLFLLGVGWSLVLVPASTLLTESVSAADRTRVQGGSDAAMNVSAAIGAAGSGPLLGLIGFGGLNALSAAIVLAAVPLLLSARRLRPAARPT